MKWNFDYSGECHVQITIDRDPNDGKKKTKILKLKTKPTKKKKNKNKLYEHKIANSNRISRLDLLIFQI